MNREIVVGMVRDHEEGCLHKSLSKTIEEKKSCTFCQNVNRDTLLLITRMRGARDTIDIGLALSSFSRPEPYKPYSVAGFSFFYPKSKNSSGRNRAVLQEAFERGYESVVLIAHGAPNIPLRYLDDAINRLRSGVEIILGPAVNGKFYLIGLKRSGFLRLESRNLLDDMDFDNGKLGTDTVDRIKSCCPQYAVLPEWYTIETFDDLRKLREDSNRGRGWKASWTTCLADDII
jgi:glycosyltransferase A (GT-A) superfamily protein (DUF2064 family)